MVHRIVVLEPMKADRELNFIISFVQIMQVYFYYFSASSRFYLTSIHSGLYYYLSIFMSHPLLFYFGLVITPLLSLAISKEIKIGGFICLECFVSFFLIGNSSDERKVQLIYQFNVWLVKPI